MNQPTYLGKTVEEYLRIFDYDKENGVVVNKSTGKRVGSVDVHGMITHLREGKKVLTISLGKLCYFLVHNEDISKKKVTYLDKDPTNLRPDNIVLVGKVNSELSGRFPVQTTEKEGVFYNPNNGLFVVRRGNEQAVYRTLSYQEAVGIRLEWEEDNSIHRWDRFSERYFKYL